MLPALLLPLVAFTTTAFAVPTSHPVEKRTNPITTTNGYVSPGPYGLCIKDSVHERVLNKAYFGDHEHMTHGRCSDFCFNKGHNTFGVEFGQECFCGDKHDVENKEKAYNCDIECSGDHTQNCGGHSALLVFHTALHPPTPYVPPVVHPAPPLPAPGTTIHGFKTDGLCYRDQHPRTIQGYMFASDYMTPTLCVEACRDKGYNTAGVEYGRECFCSFDEVPTNAPLNHEGCVFPCAGDKTKNCGGHSALVVYERHVPTPNGPKHVENHPTWYDTKKCFKDSQHRRLLTDLWASDDMKHSACVSHCKSKGKNLAGLEYGRECWCGEKLHVKNMNPENAYNCDMGCSSNNGERCGGSDALTILTEGANW